ncbi:MAG: shikimate dehydrogenase [Actinomycetota bacterium]|nr:shikimate dehydrogenase [Actinomycetota bacterium]
MPIAHSLSPVLHRAAYRELGLEWEYDAVQTDVESLPAFVQGLGPEWRGLSLTMPLKRAVLPLLDASSETVRRSGAANTVLLTEHGLRSGHNTDVPGMVRALGEHGVADVRSAVIVGGGATATSAVLALARLGCREVTLRVREPARAQETVDVAGRLAEAPAVRVARLAEAGWQAVDVVVSTVPAAAQSPEVTESMVSQAAVVFDVVYDPWPTPVAAAGAAGGKVVVDGLGLLVHQAALQVELMTGCEQAPLEEMRAAGEAALQRSRRGEETS